MGTSRQTPPSSELRTFSDRLNKAIAFKKIDISTLAKKFKCAPADIKKMMNGMREPSMKKLIVLANILECSVDYLLGLTPEARSASAVVMADTDALKPQQRKLAQTSGQISDKAGQFLAIIPEMFESDIELLSYIAGFLIERKKKNFSKFVQAVTVDAKKDIEKVTHFPPPAGTSDSEFEDGLESDFEDDDALWDDEGFEDDELGENEGFDDDFDDKDFY